jgi:hypothetical protein
MAVLQGSPSDSLRAVIARVFEAPAYQWETPRNPFAFLGEFRDRILGWLYALRDAHPAAYVVLLTALTILLVAILIHLAYLTWRALHPQPQGVRGPAAPVTGARDALWYLKEAERLAETGRFAEALGHRFVALVLQLDERAVLAFDPSKTPAEYLPEVRFGDVDRRRFAELVTSLYRHLFGGEPCDEGCVSRFDREAASLGAAVATR